MKENLLAYGRFFKALSTLLRIAVFEKFSMIFLFVYLVLNLAVGVIFSVIHWGVGIAWVVLALLIYAVIFNKMEFIKRWMIRKGDRVEYADPEAKSQKEIFKQATVLLKMRQSEVAKSQLIRAEWMDDSKHFYLVERNKKPFVIAYDWITSLESELLDS